jgi:NAD(P)-dependent dehydrogenase (short-subunit alcohol dehydrogenase family)
MARLPPNDGDLIMKELAGKVSLITGGSRGIGRAVAALFAREGSQVVICGRDKAALDRARDGHGEHSARIHAIAADVAVAEDVARLVSETVATFGRLDILVCNAGAYEIRPFSEMSEADWSRMLDVNLTGTFRCIKASLPHLVRAGKAAILTMGSIAGKTGSALPLCHYASSKAAIHCLTKSLARELAPLGIRVNCICPGVIETEMTREIIERKRGEIPLGIGAPQDVAEAALYLASDRSRYVTGEILDVNGGLLMD